MAVRFAINGFGRIGRLVARRAATRDSLELVGVNDITDAQTLAYLFKHGEGELNIGGRVARVTAERDPARLPWKELGVDIVIESTGIFRTAEQAGAHLAAGARKVIISAPPKGPDVRSFVVGVNHEQYDPDHDHVVSNASCTTNCVVPVAGVLHENYRIVKGFMTTVHAYTGDQRLLDAPHSDLRRARAAAMSMIPTTARKIMACIINSPSPDISR